MSQSQNLESGEVLTLVERLMIGEEASVELNRAMGIIRNDCDFIMYDESFDGVQRRMPFPVQLSSDYKEFPKQTSKLMKDKHQEVRFLAWSALYRPLFLKSRKIASFFQTYSKAEELFQSPDAEIPNARELADLIEAQTSGLGFGDGFGRGYSQIKRDFLDSIGCRLKNYKGKKLVDLGCSHSDFADEVRRRFYIDAYGLDVAFHETFSVWENKPYFAQNFKKSLEAKKINLDRRIAGSITNLPFEDDSVDCYVSHQSIPYLPQAYYEMAFKEIVRTLKPDGDAFIFPVREGIDNLLMSLGIKSDKIKSHFTYNQGEVYFKK